jgi:hypothetical protein
VARASEKEKVRAREKARARERKWMSRGAVLVHGVLEARRGGCDVFENWLTGFGEDIFRELAI